jgi:hypothetical protein
MKEAFIHYVWRAKRFNLHELTTTQGEPIQILHFGQYNTDSGPDFKHAKVRIGDTLWAGHVEMHLRSSDWTLHMHQTDPAYENVVLHVVLHDDTPIYHTNGSRIPCLVLKDQIHQQVLQNYQRLQFHEPWVPCQKQIENIPQLNIEAWLDRMLIERLEEKAFKLKRVLTETKYDWEESFYICLARSFGLNKNGDAFEALAKKIPLKILKKHRDQPMQVEALLFGCAGLLPGTFSNDHPSRLQKEFRFLKQKYGLKEINPVMWQFFRMRPVNFPPVRIAQFASLLTKTSELLKTSMQAQTTEELLNWFGSTKASHFWNTHYHFHKESPNQEKFLGRAFLELMVLNTIAPFLYLYGSEHRQQQWIERAIDWVIALPPEKNVITRKWKSIGLCTSHAGHSQGLIHLKRNYCDNKACLDCALGHQILSFVDKSSPEEKVL